MAVRHEQKCGCGYTLTMIHKPTPHYRPFEPYFDEGLGVHVTGKQHRRRVMRDLGFDFRDHMSKGDQSMRLDKVNEARKRKERARR